jgi:hypothetical protein
MRQCHDLLNRGIAISTPRGLRIVLRVLFCSVLAFSLVMVPGKSAAASQKRVQKRFRVGPGARLTLKTHTGSITLIGGTSNEVSIDVNIRGRDKDVRGFEVTAEQSGNQVDVSGSLQTQGAWIWYLPDLRVSYEVTVPRECGLRLHTSEGYITVHNVEGVLKGGTAEGDISISRCNGDIDLDTFSGSLKADSCVGTIGMRTSCGGINFTAITGDVDVSTSAGDVRIVDVEGKIRAWTAGGNMIVKMRGSNKGVHVESSGGDVELFLPPSVAGDIDAESVAGVVKCFLRGRLAGEIGENELDAKINGGGSPIYAHTVGGDVRLLVAD